MRSWRLHTFELAPSGSWSGIYDFRQLEWSWHLQEVGVEQAVGVEVVIDFRQLE